MQVKSSGNFINIRLTFWEKIFSLHGDFKIQKKDIVRISGELPKSTWRDLRIPGTFLPFVIKAGTYLTPRGLEFWYITRNKRHPVVLTIKNNRYKQLILGFPSKKLSQEAISQIGL